MSKAKLKKHFDTLTRDQVVEVVLDLYDARKEAKEYLEFYLSPDSEGLMEKSRLKIRGYFTARTGRPLRRPKFGRCAKVIADYASLSPDSRCVAELMIYYTELGVDFLKGMRRGREQHYTSVKTAFARAVKFIASQGMLPEYAPRLRAIIDDTDRRGWGLADLLLDIYDSAIQ